MVELRADSWVCDSVLGSVVLSVATRAVRKVVRSVETLVGMKDSWMANYSVGMMV